MYMDIGTIILILFGLYLLSRVKPSKVTKPKPKPKPRECIVPEPSDSQMKSGHFYLRDSCGKWHEYLYTPKATPIMPWATKGYWSSGYKGGLLAPITVAMAMMRYSGIGYLNDFPLKIAAWYKVSYPNLWG